MQTTVTTAWARRRTRNRPVISATSADGGSALDVHVGERVVDSESAGGQVLHSLVQDRDHVETEQRDDRQLGHRELLEVGPELLALLWIGLHLRGFQNAVDLGIFVARAVGERRALDDVL